MKPEIYLLLLLCLSISSCRRDAPGKQEEPTVSGDTLQQNEALVDAMPPMKELPKPKAIITKNTEKSPFKNLGCCADEKKRVSQDCCCALLLIEYEKIKKNEDPVKVGEIKIKDPILGDCRKKMRVEFKKLEDPPKSDEDLI
jgi:hypothetical protein